MKILAVEDDLLLASALEMFVRKLDYEWLGVTDNSEDFLNRWRATKPDLVLVDIHIRGFLDGIEVAKVINQSDHPIPIIFITSLKDEEVFERAKTLNPFAFILKPFDELALQRTIELAVYKYTHNTWEEPEPLHWKNDIATPKVFFVKVGQKLHKIKAEDIDFIRADNKHSQIVSNTETYTVRLSLSDIATKLAKSQFMRVHRSYIINFEKIDEVHLKKHQVSIGKHEIPFSMAYKEALLTKLDLLT